MGKTGNKSITLTIRLNRDDKKSLYRAAKLQGKSIAEYIVETCLPNARSVIEKKGEEFRRYKEDQKDFFSSMKGYLNTTKDWFKKNWGTEIEKALGKEACDKYSELKTEMQELIAILENAMNVLTLDDCSEEQFEDALDTFDGDFLQKYTKFAKTLQLWRTKNETAGL